MAWFNFLREQGIFDPKNNPDPRKVEDGYLIPYWDALDYLEKLSIQISEGKETELIQEILDIIKQVSLNPKDNYRTWYKFIKILSNLPNDNISLEIINYIPKWFSGKFDSMLQTSELCDKLLPKFLDTDATATDIEKAELLLSFIFSIEEMDPEELTRNRSKTGYRTRIYLNMLSRAFEKSDLAERIAKFCSDKFILEYGRTLKKLLIYYPHGINSTAKCKHGSFNVKVLISDTDLVVSSSTENDNETKSDVLNDYEEYEEDSLFKSITEIINNQRTEHLECDYANVQSDLKFALNNDRTSSFRFDSIAELKNRYDKDDLTVTFAFIFRDILCEIAKLDPNRANGLLEIFCYDKKYKIPFFKRITLYVVSKNWKNTKEFFWKLLKNNDPYKLFSEYKYRAEVYELLKTNQAQLSNEEKTIISKIIDIGEQANKIDLEDYRPEYWQLRWYSALNKIEPFKQKYEELSKVLKVDQEHYENIGKVRIRSGSISPVKLDDLQIKSNFEIASILVSFQPKDNWEEPNISGLADIFGKAVESDPEKFYSDLNTFLEIPFIYVYKMLASFAEVWKKGKSLDWKRILEYCYLYISNPKFDGDDLKRRFDGCGVTSDWIIGETAWLVSEGMEFDKKSFELELLPEAKKVLILMSKKLKIEKNSTDISSDYVNYVFNTTQGKVLKTAIHYSLRRARNIKEGNKGKWEDDVKNIFEKFYEADVIDVHILIGLYYQQFYYLEKSWIENKIKKYEKASEEDWKAFFGGFLFSSPPFTKEVYNLFYPHYSKAITQDIENKGHYGDSLARHLITFYFWEYEGLESSSLLSMFIDKSEGNGVLELVNFMGHQDEYQKALNKEDKDRFQKRVLVLWKTIAQKFENSKTEENRKVLAALSHLIIYIPELNSEYTELLTTSIRNFGRDYDGHRLIEDLVDLKNHGNPKTNAKFLGKILLEMEIKEHFMDLDEENLIDLVTFLFQNQEAESAKIFCNKMAANQYLFLRKVYDEYTSNSTLNT